MRLQEEVCCLPSWLALKKRVGSIHGTQVDQWLLVWLSLVSLCSWLIIVRKECWARWARDLIQQSTAYTAIKKTNVFLVFINRRIESRLWKVKFHHVLHHPNDFKRNTLKCCDDKGCLLWGTVKRSVDV